jgi:hypothetical protein
VQSWRKRVSELQGWDVCEPKAVVVCLIKYVYDIRPVSHAGHQLHMTGMPAVDQQHVKCLIVCLFVCLFVCFAAEPRVRTAPPRRPATPQPRPCRYRSWDLVLCRSARCVTVSWACRDTQLTAESFCRISFAGPDANPSFAAGVPH